MKTYLKFACIYCGKRMEYNLDLAGRQMLCPGCMHPIVIPPFAVTSTAGRPPCVRYSWERQVPKPGVEVPTRYK
jgi:DNA-directed RNA polymerase subunit RPC12/RpoP